MRVTVSALTLEVEHIRLITDISQLAALAPKLDLTAIVERPEDEDGEPAKTYRVRYEREHPAFAIEELVNIAVILALANNQSGEKMVEQLRQGLKSRHFPMDKPIQDVMGIGEGPNHEGHHDD